MTRYPDFDNKVLIDYLNSNQQFNEILNKLQLEDRSFSVGDLWIQLSIKTSFGECNPIIQFNTPEWERGKENAYLYMIEIEYGSDQHCLSMWHGAEAQFSEDCLSMWYKCTGIKTHWSNPDTIPIFSEKLIAIASNLWIAFKDFSIPPHIADHHWIV